MDGFEDLGTHAARVAEEYNRLLAEVKKSPLPDSLKAQLLYNLLDHYLVKAGLREEKSTNG